MKFMANGAVTLGTMDGANVEIAGLVGQDNIFTFGASSDEVIRLYAQNGYHPLDYYHRPGIEYLVDFLLTPQMLSLGDPAMLWALWNDMKYKDWFMALLDVESYIAEKERALAAYEDRTAWARKMLVNIAKSGYFSSDRTIAQYDADIWHLRPAAPSETAEAAVYWSRCSATSFRSFSSRPSRSIACVSESLPFFIIRFTLSSSVSVRPSA